MKNTAFCAMALAMMSAVAVADTTMTYSGDLPVTQTVLFQNASLLAVKGLSLDGYQKFGGLTDTRTYTIYEGEESTGAPSSGYYRNSILFGYANNGSTLTVEFHGVNTYGSYNGIGNGFELKLTQSGNDILGEVTWMAGFTGANDMVDTTWAGKKKSNFNDWNSTSATYSTSGSNLTLVFRETESHTVTFVDWDGTVLDTQTVAFGQGATAPVNPSRANYVFAGWDTPFTAVTENLTVTALYHSLFTVTFLDADGTTLVTQTVEETTSATAPDMTGHTYNGYPFSGWDTDFSSVTSNLTVTAQYVEPPRARARRHRRRQSARQRPHLGRQRHLGRFVLQLVHDQRCHVGVGRRRRCGLRDLRRCPRLRPQGRRRPHLRYRRHGGALRRRADA